MTTEKKSSIGLEVWKGDWEGAEWTITGYPKKEFCIRDFDSAYDFEDLVKEKINSKGITFDTEFCQFFAYAKTKARAEKFLADIEKYFQGIRELLTVSK